ncbi:probable protein phosphatase 2C 2 [Phragmites australis]|uniref:probable protein phosphatase 2C 2 n=1 Tax=Phragmites australis TaxID=29695 RepID=UPI002D788FC0|nr:probable protein phosphatase 2C 2 [Phragmites australis]
MVAGAEVMHQVVPLLEAPFHRCVVKSVEVVEEVVGVAPTLVQPAASPKAVVEVAVEVPDLVFKRSSNAGGSVSAESLQFVPSIRSGSFADIGPRQYMEDEHIRIDDLSGHLGSLLMCTVPSAFYGVFDGHGGSDAAAYMKKHAMRLFFADDEFPQTSQEDGAFAESVEDSIRKAFLRADLALADDSVINRSAGTTALTALVLGRQLLVANAGDCRAVLCRKGVAVEMSRDHRPTYDAERQRVVESGGYIEDGYLNGVLSVTRALGDWDMKMPQGLSSPLIAEPEILWTTLTEDDEFLIIGCDGIWDVMTSQHAVSTVRKGLRRHDDPERCARELAMEAKRLETFDNLTVIVVCFVSELGGSSAPLEQAPAGGRIRCCKSLSPEALCNLRRWLESDH